LIGTNKLFFSVARYSVQEIPDGGSSYVTIV